MTEEIKRYDFLGQELNIGDKVIYISGKYKGTNYFSTGIIKRFTPKYAIIDSFSYEVKSLFQKIIKSQYLDLGIKIQRKHERSICK